MNKKIITLISASIIFLGAFVFGDGSRRTRCEEKCAPDAIFERYDNLALIAVALVDSSVSTWEDLYERYQGLRLDRLRVDLANDVISAELANELAEKIKESDDKANFIANFKDLAPDYTKEQKSKVDYTHKVFDHIASEIVDARSCMDYCMNE